MKILQLRQVLEAAASQHDQLDRAELSSGLRKLALALQPADKLDVAKVIQKLRR